MADTCCSVPIVKNKDSFFNTDKWRLIVLFVGIALCVLSYFWGSIINHETAHILMYFNPSWIVIAVCGYPLAYGGFVNLFKYKKIKTSLLITVAMLACIALEILVWTGVIEGDNHSHGNLFAAAEIALLMWLGELLEDFTVKRSRKGVEALINLSPTSARIKMGSQYVELDAEYVNIDDLVLVKPNELIPVDGVITEGETSVSQAAITGESIPLDKTVGDEVFAGTFNQNGAITIRVTKKAENSALAKMIKLVKEAESKKAPIERTADKWAKVIVPSAITLSIAVFLIAFFAFGTPWQVALERAVTILVVFCPCSLALATPTAIAAGIGNASRRGVLVKSGSALESLGKTQVAVFDKTGTLTLNKLSVADYVTEIDETSFFKYLGAAEKLSEHPISKAIVDFCAQKTELPQPTNLTSMVGVGVKATVSGKNVIAAKADYFKDYSPLLKQKKEQMLKNGLTVIGVSVDDIVVGFLGLSDVVKPDAKNVIARLDDLTVKSVMLTGDNQSSANAVATQVGIKQYKHDLMPADKVAAIEAFKQEGRNVLMIGDGVNDAPSLTTATTSIAMGALGSDAALEVADIVLMNDDLIKVGGMIKLSRKVLTTIKTNIILGMSFNVIAVILSLLGLINPVLGALLHNVSSVFVVGNSALILSDKRSFKG